MVEERESFLILSRHLAGGRGIRYPDVNPTFGVCSTLQDEKLRTYNLAARIASSLQHTGVADCGDLAIVDDAVLKDHGRSGLLSSICIFITKTPQIVFGKRIQPSITTGRNTSPAPSRLRRYCKLFQIHVGLDGYNSQAHPEMHAQTFSCKRSSAKVH